MHPPDEQLVAAYLERGDQVAFRMLVERHQERIYGYLLGMVGEGESKTIWFGFSLRSKGELQRTESAAHLATKNIRHLTKN